MSHRGMHHSQQQEQAGSGGTPQRAHPTQQPAWAGPALALDQIQALLYQIVGAEEPTRLDIINQAANEALAMVSLMQQWLSSLPPGAIPATLHKPGEPAV